MKKTTKKSAPAAKAAATAPKAATVTKASAPKAPAKKATGAAPARKAPSARAEAAATFISARADIGFGNHLYLRGEGPGLSWDHGVPMDCVASDGWAYTLQGATAPVTFKVLINDVTWCSGNDYVVEPGQSVTVAPSF